MAKMTEEWAKKREGVDGRGEYRAKRGSLITGGRPVTSEGL